MQVEAVGAVVELRNPQAQELGKATIDPQVRRVSKRIRAHPGHADQRLVFVRVEPPLRYLDVVGHRTRFLISPASQGARMRSAVERRGAAGGDAPPAGVLQRLLPAP
jgi:hypothetical protein